VPWATYALIVPCAAGRCFPLVGVGAVLRDGCHIFFSCAYPFIIIIIISALQVAVKRFSKRMSAHHISREVGILSRLRHPNIVSMLDMVEDEEHVCLVLELVTGGELLQYVTEKGRLPEKETQRLFVQLLTAVEYMHSCGVVSRDLKLENLLLDASNNVKIIDFSVGTFSGPLESVGTFCGSPDYVAPEVWELGPYCGEAADMWSCGVVLYTLLSGRLPFASPMKAIQAEWQFSSDIYVSSECAELVGKMLTVDPAIRLTARQVLAHPWCQEGIVAAKEMDSNPAIRPHPGLQRTIQSSESPTFAGLDVMHTSVTMSSLASGGSVASISSLGAERKWKICVLLPTGGKMRIPVLPTRTIEYLATGVTRRARLPYAVTLWTDTDAQLHPEDEIGDVLDEGETVIARRNGRAENPAADADLPAPATVPSVVKSGDNRPLTKPYEAVISSTCGQVRVCLVDDDEFTQTLVEGMLARMIEDMVAVRCNNGQEAVDECQRNQYDLIIMDCQMPVMDGFKATENLRAEGMNAETVIIGLSGSTREEDRDHAHSVGMSDYMRKPLWMADFQGKLVQWHSQIIGHIS